jgi:hypothetical protein
MSVYKLGRQKSQAEVKLKLSTIFGDSPPSAPAVFGYEGNFGDAWGMLGNDEVGDCVIAGGAHEDMVFSRMGGLAIPTFSTVNTLSDYSAITGYVNGNLSTDNGTDMISAASYRQKTGLLDASGVRHKIDAYAEIPTGDLDKLSFAAWLFGAAGVGVNLPSSAETQFGNGQIWDVFAGDTIIGGHYIPCVGRNSKGNYVFVTWGRLQAATPAWVKTYMEEGLAYLSLEIINTTTKLAHGGYNLAALEGYLKNV